MMTSITAFEKMVRDYYEHEGRDLPWRRTCDPYRILVSEIMLQQTQVSRVISFYKKFIKRFPSFTSLTKAKTRDVLHAWQGLGYNRRALSLQKIAKIVVQEHGGKLPRDREALKSLPGIGDYTAGAIRAFAFGERDAFVETNIRRTFIHHFFPRQKNVRDEEIVPILTSTIGRGNIREWYWALMDYGAMLGTREKLNPNQRSAHYAKQPKFAGSDREVRGKLLKILLAKKKISFREAVALIPEPEERLRKIIGALQREGFIEQKNQSLNIMGRSDQNV
jgi:A/G-specific adenine glycosylase